MEGACLRRWYWRHPYQVLLVSDGAKAEIERYYRFQLAPKRVHYGCPISNACERVDRSIPVIGFVGQFVQQKNLEPLD